jgi:hypothetical protein
MLLNYLDRYASRMHSRKSYPAGGGRWVLQAAVDRRRMLDRYADRIATLPLALHVEGAAPYQVMHGDLLPLGGRTDALFCAPTLCVHEADRATSSRRNLADAQEARFRVLPFAQRRIRVSDRPLGALPLTYVGHSRTREVTVHDSYVYIEQGVSAGDGERIPPTPPTVIEHAQFAPWVRGVAAACARPGTRDASAEARPLDPIASAG